MKLLYYFPLKYHLMSICTFMLSHSIRFFVRKGLFTFDFTLGVARLAQASPLCRSSAISHKHTSSYIAFYSFKKTKGEEEQRILTLPSCCKKTEQQKKKGFSFDQLDCIALQSRSRKHLQIFCEENMNKSICSQFHSTTEVKSIVHR